MLLLHPEYPSAIIAHLYAPVLLYPVPKNNVDNNTYPTYNATAANAKMTILPNGNVGIGITNPNTQLHIEHSSTSFNAANGGLYLFNPNNTTNSCSCLGARINGTAANKAGISLDVNGYYGWSMYINGNDTTERWLRFNSSWDGSGTERLQIRGSDGYTNINGGCSISNGCSIGGDCTINGNVNTYGLFSYKSITQPLTFSYTFIANGNPTSFILTYKNFSNLIVYIGIQNTFGTFVATGIAPGVSFTPSSMFNSSLSYYIPYFTNQNSNGSVCWIYNASNVRVYVTEFWF